MTVGELQTITVGADDDNPEYSICPGHVTPEVFADAFHAEGWDETDLMDAEDLAHEYWRELPGGGWKCSNVGDPEAKPVTVMSW